MQIVLKQIFYIINHIALTVTITKIVTSYNSHISQKTRLQSCKKKKILLLFFFFLIKYYFLCFSFSFEHNTSFYLAVQMLHLNEYSFYNLHTSVHDWQVTVVRWLFMSFSQDFLVLTIKRILYENQDHLFKGYKQLTQLSTTQNKIVNSSSKLNKVHSHEM